MPTIRVGEITMYYEVHGVGDPVVMIPGLATGVRTCFFRQIAGLARDCRVIAIDNRCSGLSDKPDTACSMEMMADDAAGLLGALGVRRAHVFGISMGGMVAQHLALRHPGMVASLILACTSCGGKHTVPPDREYVEAVFKTEGSLEERLRARLHFHFTQDFIDGNPGAIRDFISAHLERPAPFHAYIRHAEAVLMHDTYDRLPEIKVPTLVIAGGADRAQPVENSRILASRIPNAEIMVMDGLRHFLTVECPEELNKAMTDFFRLHPIE